MPTNCVKVVRNSVKKYAKKFWNSFVQKCVISSFTHHSLKFTVFSTSFSQAFLTRFFEKIHLLNKSFTLFPQTSTITTNINNIKDF